MSDTWDTFWRTSRYVNRAIPKQIKAINDALTKASNQANVFAVSYLLEQLIKDFEGYKSDYRKALADIDPSVDKKSETNEQQVIADFEPLETQYTPVVIAAKLYINKYEEATREASSSSSPNASFSMGAMGYLPKRRKVPIPDFDGSDPEKFLEFAAIFEKMYHNDPNISKIEKLATLKSACKLEAHSLIEHMPFTDAGYDSAWKALNDQYRNMKRIIHCHFDDLFAIPRITKTTDVPELFTKVTKALEGLKACKLNIELWSEILSYIVSEKLDRITFEEFEKANPTKNEYPSWDLLRAFLEQRCSLIKRKSDSKPEKAVSTLSSSSSTPTPSKRTNKRAAALNTTFKSNSKTNSPSNKPSCVICSQSHLLIECDTFKSKSERERQQSLKGKNVCQNCFNYGHTVNACTKDPRCQCKMKHHPMLHFPDEEKQKDTQTPSTTEKEPSLSCVQNVTDPASNTSLLSVRKPTVLLPTAVVKFKNGNKTGEMRVLLDSCSTVNLITQSFVHRNKLPTTTSPFYSTVVGVTNTDEKCNRVVKLSIESRTQSFRYDTSFNVIQKLPYSISGINSSQLPCDLSNYKLADPAYYDSTINIPEIDALLGIQAYDYIVSGSVLRLGSACLRDTKLGWTISSNVYPKSPSKRNETKIDPDLCCLSVERIDQRLKRFWETEEVSVPKSETTEAENCNAHFEKTFQRNEDGKFVVRLPFKRDPASIVGNYNRVLSYQKQVEKRLNDIVAKLYDEFMQEYIDLGHMTIIPNADKSNRYFIPHHAVMKPSSTTTKLRVVFHASFQGIANESLNDVLMVGPVVQPELFDILLRFRTFKYAATCDAAKMYRCVLVHPSDRIYQSIIWKSEVYELNTVTYGTGPASYLATKCLLVLADEIEPIDPIVAYILRYCFYMDDGMYGADTVKELIRIRKVLHQLLASAGFVLRKYQSNSPEVLASIEPELIETKLTKNLGGDEALSVLGLSWTPKIDEFQPRAELTESNAPVTKRLMLSTIAKLFDPLGLAAPVVIRGKLLLQRVWKLGLAWDAPVPDEITVEFHSYVNDINLLQRFTCPRYSGFNTSTSIVGFADASESAYCAVVYLLTHESGRNRSEIYCAKTRVAPVKPLTVPQLELQAAVLLVELVNRVRHIITVPDDRIHLFSDATIVLSWLARPPSDWKVFIRNRVAKIISNYPADRWNHVSSKLNPADIATRGFSTEQLINSALWKHGPEFLCSGNFLNPNFEYDDRCLAYLSKPKATVMLVTENSDSKLIYSCSSYYKLLRIFATAKVLARRKRTKSNESIVVTADDISFAENYILRIVQQCEFAEDYQRLSEQRKLRKRSRLCTLNPFIDDNGLIRSKSSLQNANVPFNRKCPVILPANGHFATIFVRYFHERYFHANRPFIVTHLSTRFTFVGGLNRLAKHIVLKCVTCRRYFSQTKPQQMSDLPADRVTPRSPFEATGVDFTGAFTVKCNFHRVLKYAKAYAAIFVCMVTRAVHIELVPALSSEEFLNAFKCFIARRGLPKVMYSDNGTNFTGAERFLNLKDADISRYAAEKRIDWQFIPPYTPHRGGIWESAVKSAKRFLPLITKDQTFTYNELRVLLTQIESMLNSRPIAYRNTAEPNEEILTPGHFLIGRNLCSLPEPSTSGTLKLSEQYRANRKRVEDFWKVWSTDYLNQLRCRSKWLDVQPNPTEGQIILYKESINPPSQWPLARINRVFPDRQNVVRTVEILVNGQLKTVPTIQIIHLPTEP